MTRPRNTHPSTSNALHQVLGGTYKPIKTMDELHTLIQAAVTLEFSTIPPYLTALYSMCDTTCDAYRITRSIALEEMFHVYQASNLLISVEGIPKYTNTYTPAYPTYIDGSDHDVLPYIGLRPASREVYKDTFMRIETPAPYNAPAENEKFRSIAQFYYAIEKGLEYLEDEASQQGQTIFKDTEGYTQNTDFYIGKGSGQLIQVTDLSSARKAIKQIIDQGEGAVNSERTMMPFESWGAYNHYSLRFDGQYGPVLGAESIEISHYFKFKAIADGYIPLPSIYPAVTLDRDNEYSHAHAEALCKVFDGYYSVFLKSMEESFKTSEGEEENSYYYKTALPIMHSILPELAVILMKTPAWKDGDPDIGPTAIPHWRYTDQQLECVNNTLEKQIAELKGKPDKRKLVNSLESILEQGKTMEGLCVETSAASEPA